MPNIPFADRHAEPPPEPQKKVLPSWGTRPLSAREYDIDTHSSIRRQAGKHKPNRPVVYMPDSGLQIEFDE
jgi:hypothetical protein